MIELKHTKVYVDGIEQNTKVYVNVNKPLPQEDTKQAFLETFLVARKALLCAYCKSNPCKCIYPYSLEKVKKAPLKPICHNCRRVNCTCDNPDMRERKRLSYSTNIVRTVTVSEQVRSAKRSMLTAQKRIELLEKKVKDLANTILLLTSE